MKIHASIFFRRISVAFLPVMLAAVSSMRAESPPTARNLPNLMPAPEFVLQYEADIALSPAQRSQIESAIGELQQAAQEAAAQVRQESNVLAQLLAREKPDEAKVASQFEKVLVAENDVKRARLKLSLRTRAVLTADQRRQLELLQNRVNPRRTPSIEQQELAEKMTRVKVLIEQAKAEGRDLGNVRAMWKRVDQATQEGRIADACRILDETITSIAVLLEAPAKK